MLERGTKVDHSTLNRWVIEFAPLLENEFRKNHKKKTGSSWRMDETYIKIKGVWNYLYRAVDKEGDTIDFMLSKNRDEASAKAFFTYICNWWKFLESFMYICNACSASIWMEEHLVVEKNNDACDEMNVSRR